MSHWNYRVCKVKDDVTGGDLFSVQEVYYDDEGKPTGFCDASVSNWETLEDLTGTLRLMLKALNKPVIGD